MRDNHSFNPRELNRHQIIEHCLLGKLTNQEAGETLNLSRRQIQRLKKELAKQVC